MEKKSKEEERLKGEKFTLSEVEGSPFNNPPTKSWEGVKKMAIIRWDPWSLAPRWGFRFPSFWNEEDWFDASEGLSMYETDNDIVVEAAVPGVPTDKVDVSVKEGVLTIKAEHKEVEEEKKKIIHRGTHQARFFYQASLPTAVKADKAQAEVEDGVVKVTIPKAEEARPKTIKVKTKKK